VKMRLEYYGDRDVIPFIEGAYEAEVLLSQMGEGGNGCTLRPLRYWTQMEIFPEPLRPAGTGPIPNSCTMSVKNTSAISQYSGI